MYVSVQLAEDPGHTNKTCLHILGIQMPTYSPCSRTRILHAYISIFKCFVHTCVFACTFTHIHFMACICFEQIQASSKKSFVCIQVEFVLRITEGFFKTYGAVPVTLHIYPQGAQFSQVCIGMCMPIYMCVYVCMYTHAYTYTKDAPEPLHIEPQDV